MFSPEKRIIQRAVRYPLIAVALLLLSAGLALAAPAGTVVGLLGQCFVESGGTRSALTLGQPVQVADTVDVPEGGKLKLRMADGSVVSLASGTRMAIAAYAVNAAGQRQDGQLSLSQGLLRAVVTPVERPARFEVDTAVGTAAVRSTDWFVEALPTTMRVRVLRGSVEMTSAATKRSITIPARSGAHLEAGHDPSRPRVLRRSELNTLIGRTRVAHREERHRAPARAPGRAHAAGPHRDRMDQHRARAAARPSAHPVQEDRQRRGMAPEHPAGGEPGGRQGK